jgi:hypothetical protein
MPRFGLRVTVMGEDSPRRPVGLREPGRRLWAAVVGGYMLTPAEIEMLSEACRTVDELDRLTRAVRALPELTTAGSTGQVVAHPLLAEVRAHRRILERLAAALHLPQDIEEASEHGRGKAGEANSKLAELRAFSPHADHARHIEPNST